MQIIFCGKNLTKGGMCMFHKCEIRNDYRHDSENYRFSGRRDLRNDYFMEKVSGIYGVNGYYY